MYFTSNAPAVSNIRIFSAHTFFWIILAILVLAGWRCRRSWSFLFFLVGVVCVVGYFGFLLVGVVVRFGSCCLVLVAILVLVGWCCLVPVLVVHFGYLLSALLTILALVGWCFWCWCLPGVRVEWENFYDTLAPPNAFNCIYRLGCII